MASRPATVGEGKPVGEPGGYTDRPGFAHGGAGVAACWYGGARGVGQALLTATAKRDVGPHALAHLGAVDITLHTTRDALEHAAGEIDADPGDRELLRRTADTDPAATWLATTDADTVVPPGWLRRQLSYARQGWDMVLGTVTVTDWAGHPPHTAAVFAARYESGPGPHPHVHGANLGIRASAYLAAGGFKPLRTAEDHALTATATEAGCRVLQASDITVVTSARRQARTPRGFGHLLRSLAREPDAGSASAAAGNRPT